MKKNYLMILAAAAVCLVAACNKNESEVAIDEPVTVTIIKANANEINSKATIDDSDASFAWSAGDKIAVFGGDQYYESSALTAGDIDAFGNANFAIPAITEGNRADFAVFPSSIVASMAPNHGQSGSTLDVTLPASYSLAQVQDDNTPCPMIAANAPSSDLHFKQLCALLRITVYNIPANTNTIELDFGQAVAGGFSVPSTVAAGSSTISTADATSGTNVITINSLGISAWTDNLVLNVPVPTGSYSNVTVTAKDNTSKVLLTMTRPVKVGSSWTAARKTARKVSAALPAFSAGAKHVAIAKSNLKCTTTDAWSTWAFSFCDNSWDLGESSISENHADATTMCFFGWGTSGCTTLGANYGANTAPNVTEYTGATAKYGPIYGNGSGNNLTGTFANGDWGVFNAIGTDAAGTWRTPTYSDYSNILARVDGSSNKMWGIAAIIVDAKTTVNGVVLLPDHFTDPLGSFVKGNQDIATNNNFTSAQWAVLAAAGAAFLPAAGRYWGTGSNGERNNSAYYWTSTAVTASNVYDLECTINSGTVWNAPAVGNRTRAGKNVVRLVRDL